MSARALLLLDLVIKVTFLDQTIGFKFADLNVSNLKTAFNITSFSYLEDPKGKRFYPLFTKDFEESISEKVYLRQEIPKKSPSVKIYPTESKFVFNTGTWGSHYTEIMIGSSVINRNVRIAAINFQDLTKIDKKQKISKVYLRLVSNFQESTEPTEVFVYRADSSWYGITTFDQYPAYRKEPYTTAIVDSGLQVPFFWDVTGIVVDWVMEVFPNFGLVLRASDTMGLPTTKNFNNTNVEKKPCLLVYYEKDMI